ncbi:ArdC family protein [Staphylococcus hyicus]|uniref:ArdC family protein n=1 Tax=Staphylococcus hyicus TaxID=1284 RepID=UPI0031334160
MNKIYEKVTNRIIEQLQKGVVPWQKMYDTGGLPINWKTGRYYRGINTLLLEAGEYATFKQISEAGGKVKKGERGHLVVFWKIVEKEDENDELVRIPILKKYVVFEINTQVEGLKSKRSIKVNTNEAQSKPHTVTERYMDSQHIKLRNTLGSPCYIPSLDEVKMPPLKFYDNSSAYYKTLMHELVHSTGHKSRLKRDGVVGKINFGSDTYSKEELIAEIGAAMLASHTELTEVNIENSASYIDNWLTVLKGDSTFVVKAAQLAQKAVDYILDEGRGEDICMD